MKIEYQYCHIDNSSNISLTMLQIIRVKLFYILSLFVGLVSTPVGAQHTADKLSYRVVDTIMTTVNSDDISFKNYQSESAWYYVQTTSPLTIMEVNLSTKKRTLHPLNVKPTPRNYLKNIYGDDQYIIAIMSQQCLIWNKAQQSLHIIRLDKNEDYHMAAIHHDTLTLAGAYNYHIRDGYPMLQVAQYVLPSHQKLRQKRYFFPGIIYTAMLNEFIDIHDNQVYVIHPLSNYYYTISSDLSHIDSFIIDPNVSEIDNRHPFLQHMDFINYHNIQQKMSGKKKYINNEWDPSVFSNLRELDAHIFRNEKLYVNDHYIFITRKPYGFKGWEKRDIFIIDKKSGRRIQRQSILDRKIDFYNPDFVSSLTAHLSNNGQYALVRSHHFYHPDIYTKSQYDTAYQNWSQTTYPFYYMLMIFQLEFE